MDPLIHPTALIESTAKIDKGTNIGPFAVIEPDTVIKKNCSIRARSIIKRYTHMGQQNQILEGAVLGGPPQDFNFKESPSFLRIGNRNVFGEGTTAHRSVSPHGSTNIGNDNIFKAYAHVAHDCLVGDKTVIGNHVSLAGHVSVESFANILSGAVIHQFCQVGMYSRVGLNCKVQQDILPFCIVEGVPGRVCGLNQETLKHAQFSHIDITNLQKALEILSRRNLKLSKKLAFLSELNCKPVHHLVSFIEKTQRGITKIQL